MGHDTYWTPRAAILPLLDREEFAEPVWEPSAGAGWISQVLTGRGIQCVSSDIRTYGYPVRRCDFLRDEPTWDFKSIIMNPPFGRDHEGLGAREWFRRACSYRPVKLAMLGCVGPMSGDCTDRTVLGEMGLKRVLNLSKNLSRFGLPGGGTYVCKWPVGWFVLVPGWVGPSTWEHVG